MISTGRCNRFGEDVCRGSPAKRLPWSPVEDARDHIEVLLRDVGQAAAVGKVLTEQAVRVLVGPTLPRTRGIAAVDLAVRGYREAAMLGELIAAIPGERAEVPRQALDRKSTRLNSSHIQKSRMPSSA